MKLPRILSKLVLILFVGWAGYLAYADFPSVKASLGGALGLIDFSVLQLWQQRGGFQHQLKYGSTSSDVTLVQRALATDASSTLETASGRLDKSTAEAIKRFQSEYGLPTSGIVDTTTLAKLNSLFFDELCPVPAGLYPDLSLAHITREQGLPQDYVPADLQDLTPLMRTEGVECVTADTASALQRMFAAAQKVGVFLSVSSGYRRPEIQKLTLDFWIAVEGARALNESAQPFHSEHQTGSAVDLAGASEGYGSVRDGFGETPEGRWLAAHAYEYGFELSYPQSNGEYTYEPWHYRYVGQGIAEALHTQNISYNQWSSPEPLVPLSQTIFPYVASTSALAAVYVSPLGIIEPLFSYNAHEAGHVPHALLLNATSTSIAIDIAASSSVEELVGATVKSVLENKSLVSVPVVGRLFTEAVVPGQGGLLNTIIVAKPLRRGGYIVMGIFGIHSKGDAAALLTTIDIDYAW